MRTKNRGRCGRRATSTCLLAAALLAAPNGASASLPTVDFDRMGKVGVAGAFAGLDFLDPSSSFAGVSLDPSTATLFARAADGSLTRLGSTGTGGKIAAGCSLGDTFYFGGTFTSIAGTTVSNIASYSTSNGVFNALGGSGAGLDGPVNALFCDSSRGAVWAGGSFHAPTVSADSSSFTGAVAVFTPKSNSWSSAAFGGLTGDAGDVLSISASPSGTSVFFTGSFAASFGSGASTPINGTNNPNVPFSSGATSFSSSLVPFSLANANITTSAASTAPGFGDITNILCPAGADGPGNTWLGADGIGAQITVREFRFLASSGLRLGQTFVQGRGSQTFCLTSIPDNNVLTLRYNDPGTDTTHTCDNECPLVSNTTVPYQDFLFDEGVVNNTGFLLTIKAFDGAGPGLHLLQLLSDGAFASAVPNDNAPSCYAPGASSVQVSGSWETVPAPTTIAGTTTDVRTQDVRVGTPSGSAPSVTWSTYLSASGNYDVFLAVPGCTNLQDCGSRTSVKVTVSPGGGLAPAVTTVSQVVQQDTSLLVYSGPVVPAAPSFLVNVEMQLADDPVGSGAGGEYHLVANTVQFVLKSLLANGTSTSGSASGGTQAGSTQQGFGFFEWPLSLTQTVTVTAGVFPNSTITPLDDAAFKLSAALGGAAGSAVITASAQHSSGTLFLAGNFTLPSGPANIVAFSGDSLAPLSSGGLNGPVSSLAISGDTLFVGGSFTDTATATGGGKFSGIVAYNVPNNKWAALEEGVDGPVSSLSFSGGQLYVMGAFTRLSGTTSSGAAAGGFAVWDTGKGVWVPAGGFLLGSMTMVANGTTGTTKFIAGSVSKASQFGASGLVMLQNSKSNIPTVVPLSVELADVPEAQAATTTRRRSWLPSVLPSLFTRQGTPALPASAPVTAPAVLAGAFWTNTSSSTEVVIFGGNFSFNAPTGISSNIGIYDPSKGTLSALHGTALTGTVNALVVIDTSLFVGGEFTIAGTQASGFAVYDLASQAWDTSMQSLEAASGTQVVVRTLTSVPSQTKTVVVGGSFASAGSLPCQGICSWDMQARQWQSLGDGIQGEVSSVAYAGVKLDTVVVGGSISLTGNAASNVAEYSLSNKTWSSPGGGQGIPGPVTALEVNDGNSSSIFAAGRSADGSAPFLVFFNGASWQSLSSSFSGSSSVSQLEVVPLVGTHAGNDILQADRMLFISGTLSSATLGSASSVLFDGQTYYPYLSTTSASGNPGLISSLFHSFTTFSFNQRTFLATGVVILISIAAAAGVVFLLALIGILWTLFARRDDPSGMNPDLDEDDDSLHRPSSLLAHINAATRKTILGVDDDPFAADGLKVAGAGAGAGAAAAVAAHHGHDDEDEGDHDDDGDGYRRSETPADAAMGVGATDDINRPAHARYSFDGTGEGELPVAAGAQLIVLDDRDPAWWYVRDPSSGREGVVPASYIF